MNQLKTQTSFLYTLTLAKGRLNAVGPALGRQAVMQVYPPCPDYKTPISGDCFDLTVQDVGICGEKCCILLTCFVYMVVYYLEI